MNKKLEQKLKQLPTTPGVYFHKDASGEIIYVGKAANLRNRVRQYFQNSRARDTKTEALVAEIADTDWMEVETELDALFVEAELIRRYMPRYNIALRDDKSFVFVRVNIKEDHPTVTFTRHPLDDGAEYFGPFLRRYPIERALKCLRKVFPFSTHQPNAVPKRACLQAQLGLCPGLEANMISLEEYRKNLRRLMGYLRGKRKAIMVDMEKEMKRAAKDKDFEKAAELRNRITSLKSLERQVIFGDRELLDISKDRGLVRLAEILSLDKPPRRVEGFDISHMSGTDNAASMVVFVSGVPDKSQYRKFKLRTPGNNDFAHMEEAITRRLSPRNTQLWGVPDLFLIDGGKGQVSAAYSAMRGAGYSIPMLGLAKRFEEVILVNEIDGVLKFDKLQLPKNDDALKLLMRIRDESHRFAISYHSVLKRNRQKDNLLESIAGIGPGTRKKLLRKFGSLKSVFAASEKELADFIGPSKARLVVKHKETLKK